MKNRAAISLVCLPAILAAIGAAAQAPVSATPSVVPPVAQSITVTTSAEPLPLADPDRSVRLFDLTDPAQQPLYNSPEDYLRLDPSILLQERGPSGLQADISLRGTTFEQTLVLIDGLRTNDPETGHENMDLAIPLDAISRIDVLHGSGSTFYGSDAIGGAINLITGPPSRSSVEVKLGGGSYNATEQHLRAAFLNRPHRLLNSEQLTAARDTSDGFYYQTPGGPYENDRGFHATVVSSDTFLNTPAGPTEILLGMSDRPYGANLFYGDFDSKERTKGWYGSIRQQFAQDISADFSYRRHTDEFILTAANPGLYENNHIDTEWQTDLRGTRALARNIDLAFGLEADGDSILSSNLGHHARNQGAGYLNFSMHALKRLSLSVGARQEIYRGPTPVFTPTAAAGYTIGRGLRAHAAYGRGFRLPSYTDLFYVDPAHVGNPSLKPETSESYEGGLDYTPTGHPRLHASATGFQLRQSDAIDYSKYTVAAPWQAMNVGRIAYTGVESSASFTPSAAQRFDVGYTFLHGSPPAPGLISEYAYNYAIQSASMSYAVTFAHQVSARTQLGVIETTFAPVYPLWNLALARSRGIVRPYVRIDNLTNTLYFEIPGPPPAPMPGRTIMGGILLTWPTSR
jgi:outer membrane cobalamin receptor